MFSRFGRLSRLQRAGVVVLPLALLIHQADTHLGARVINRNVRTLWTAARVARVLYYTQPQSLAEFDTLHRGVAQSILDVCLKNGGLYIKFGQGLSAMSSMSPPQYREVLSVLQDRAPPFPFEEVEKLFRDEFNGVRPRDIFVDFDPVPIACASIAQVHRATLLDGAGVVRPVAVKVQNPEIRRQMPYDLLVYRFVMWAFEKVFDVPVYWTYDYTATNLRQETDFLREAANSERARSLLELPDDVHIPEVHWSATSSRILTAEWCDGVKPTDLESLKRLGVSTKWVADLMVRLFAHQIFVTGFVHCDPHPGNLFVRRLPNGRPQMVLLDHGLYISESSEFRRAYCDLWCGIFLLDIDTIKRVCQQWGVRDHELFATMQLLRPFTPQKPVHLHAPTAADIARVQANAKEKMKMLLSDTSLTPRELIFVGRNMQIVRTNNRLLGSPVNRINILASYADRGRESRPLSLYFHWWKFATSCLFHLTQAWSKLNSFVGRKVGGFEEHLQEAEDMGMRHLGLRISFDDA